MVAVSSKLQANGLVQPGIAQEPSSTVALGSKLSASGLVHPAQVVKSQVAGMVAVESKLHALGS